MSEVDNGWSLVSIGFEGAPTYVEGINLWEAEWVATDRRITVAHPQHPHQRHIMYVYEVAGTRPPVVFAAGEFSAGVWGFFAR